MRMLHPVPTMSVSLLFLLTAYPLVAHGAKWAYHGPDGEHHWAKHYPFCGGTFQSPIDFQTPLLRYEPSLPPVQLINYNLSMHEQLTLSNNGHSVQLSLPSRMFISGLPYRYSAAQLHFHWGSPSLLPGSEHTVNGKQFAAELHIVHYNSDKYPNVSMAVDKSDGLAVLGILIEVGDFNPAFDHFLKYINGIRYKDQRIQVPAFNIRDLLPSRLDQYYRYDGSLTTPPCYPSVLWTVFRNPVTFSIQQFQALSSAMFSSSLQESAPLPLNGNYRKPQLADNRVVLVSFHDGRLLHGIRKAATATERRQVIQQLLLGDLADLADEQLFRLLPAISPRTRGSTRRGATSGRSQKGGHTASGKGQQQQRWQQNSLPGGGGGAQSTNYGYGATAWGRGGRYASKYDVSDKPLCYKSLAEKVAKQLRGLYSEDELTDMLKNSVFPELNLRSYLACRSELDLDTVRLIIRDRPGDEANELDHSLTRATLGTAGGHRRRPPTKSHRPPSPSKKPATRNSPTKNSLSNTNLKNSYGNTYNKAAYYNNNAYRHNRIQPYEWED